MAYFVGEQHPATVEQAVAENRTLADQGEPIGSRPVHYFDAAGYPSNPVSGITATPASAGLSRSTLARGRKADIARRPIRVPQGDINGALPQRVTRQL